MPGSSLTVTRDGVARLLFPPAAENVHSLSPALRANRTHRHPALPLEALHPAHGGGRVVGVEAAGTPRHDALAMLEIRGENSVETSEV